VHEWDDVMTYFRPVERVLPDGRILTVFALTLGRARLTIADAGDRVGYRDGW